MKTENSNNLDEIAKIKLKNSKNDKFDVILDEYFNQINIPNSIEQNIFNKIEKNNRIRKTAKSLFGLIFIKIPVATKTSAAGLMMMSVLSLVTFLSPSGINNSIPQMNNFQNLNSYSISTIVNEEKTATPLSKKDSIISENVADNLSIITIENSSISDKNLIISKDINSLETISNHNQLEFAELPIPASKFKYEIKYSSFSNLTYQETRFTEDAILRNCSFGLWYPLSSQLLAGAEFRQERFTLLNNDELQTLNLNCWEAGIKYYPEIAIFNINPFVQLNLGACNKGLISRAGLGLQLNIENDFNVMIGTEFNSLIYIDKNNIKSTERIGINFGINLILK